jgi:NAD(P)H-hydrate epimerase
MDPEKAAVAGVYLHGRAGDRVAERLGDRGLLASDVIDEMPATLREIV